MRARPLAALALLLIATGSAQAGDQLSVTGLLDVRWVNASGGLSFLNGGMGLLRFDEEHEDLRLGRAFLATRLRVTDLITVHAVIDAYGDHDRNPVDLSEFWLEIRPFPTSPLRWRARVGAFYMPTSFENRGPGWSSVYTITPSAINTWYGEEFRTIGTEIEARWLGSSSEYLGDLALVAAAYGWNEPAGTLLAERGFGLTDRPSTLFGGLGRPPITFYHEIDGRPGYYTGLTWRHHDILEVRALHYDNRADPAASTDAIFAWRTRFNSAGARLEPDKHWTFIAQYLDGNTAVGPDSDQFLMTFRALFGLASYEWRAERLTARYDDFRTHQLSGFWGPPADQNGHAWTFGWTHTFNDTWELAAEWIRVSSIFPPREQYGISPYLLESQAQLAFRYRFRGAL